MKSKWTWKDAVVLTVIIGAVVFVVRKPSRHSFMPSANIHADEDVVINIGPERADDLRDSPLISVGRMIESAPPPTPVQDGSESVAPFAVADIGQRVPTRFAAVEHSEQTPRVIGRVVYSRISPPMRRTTSSRESETKVHNSMGDTALPKCDLCGTALVARGGRWWQVWTQREPGDERHLIKLCAPCYQAPRCSVCNETSSLVSARDGQRYCRAHAPVYVDDMATANQIIADVRGKMRSLGIGTANQVPFRMVPKGTVGYGPAGTMLGRYDYRTWTENDVTTWTDEMVVERGLTVEKFVEVVAHEYAHEWQARNYPEIDANERVKEGLAVLAAALINDACGRSWRNKALHDDPSHQYGDSYRFVLRESGGTAEGLRRYLDRITGR